MALKKFTNSEIKLNTFEAHKTLSMYFGYVKLSHKDLTDADRAFAQALLFEGLRRSSPILGTLSDDQIVDNFYKQLPSSLSFSKDLVKGFVKKAGNFIWKETLTGARNDLYRDTADVRVYSDIRNAIAAQYKNAWNTRVTTGKPIIY